MKQQFELTVQQSKTFLKYFSAALRDPEMGMIHGNGEASFDSGVFVIRHSANFQHAGKRMYAIWRLVLTQEGKLLSIENLNTVDDGGGYELLLSQFLNSVLQQVVAEKTQRFFRRVHFSAISGCTLPGEYWLPGFRFAPLYPDDDSHLVNAERIVVVDHEVDAIDAMHANEVSLQTSTRLAAYMSFILDVGLQRPHHEERYFLFREGDRFSMRRQSCQLIDVSTPAKMPAKGELCKLGEFRGSVFDAYRYMAEYLVCPVETRRILRGVAVMPEDQRSAFTNCCLMYQLAASVGRYHPTVRASYECAAVDALVRKTSRDRKDFTDFMKHYAGSDDELYELMWGKIRSAHFHAGEFPLGEFQFDYDFIRGPEKLITSNVLTLAHQAVRKAILGWVTDRIDLKSPTVDT